MTNQSEESIEYLLDDIKRWEGQDLEFMEDYPASIHELAKELAAFATSNTGTIYLGVNNVKNICGISITEKEGMDKGKDSLQNRIAGVCQKSVSPAIQTKIVFINVKDDVVVARIDIPKGTEPIYYSNNIPYLRNLTISVPATADQVKEIFKQYFQNQVTIADDSPNMNELRNVLFQLSDFEIIWFDHDERVSNPDLDQMKYDIGVTGRNLINLSLSTYITSIGISNDLVVLGDKFEKMEAFQFYLDGGKSWKSFVDLGSEAMLLNNRLMWRILKNYQLREDQIPQIKEGIILNIRELNLHWKRRQQYIDQNSIVTLKEVFRKLSFVFNRYANLPLSSIGLEFSTELKIIADNLRASSVHEYSTFGKVPLESINSKLEESLELTEKIMKSY